MLFTELNLPDYILKALEKHGYVTPTEIQEKAIPVILSGRDAVGKSQTGSGKTLAFGIPAVSLCDSTSRRTEVLILSPTRELALQTTEELRKLTEFKEGCKVVPVFGGAAIDRQIQMLRKNAKIVVGTPGRIMDHMRRRTVDFSEVKMLVLDEADEMLDMGFREDMETIISKVNAERVTVMFSATMPKPILNIAETYMKNPEYVEINSTNENTSVEQKYVYVGDDDKDAALLLLIKELNPTKSLIFCNTKRMVDKLSDALNADGIKAHGLHGDMRQNERRRVLESVKNGEITFLVATDVAARGIDIHGVDVVFNYDVPKQTEYYTHRIGRTARAGKTGVAYTLINHRAQLSILDDIMRETRNEIEEYITEYSKTDKKRGSRSSDKSQYSGTYSKKSYGDRKPYGEKKSYGDRKPYGEKKSYGDRKPYGERKSFGDKPFERKPYGENAETSNFDGEKTFEKKPYGEKKSFGDRKPYGEKKSFGDRKPYGEKKSFGDRKPYGEKKSFGDRKPYGEKKSFGDKPFERKPYGENAETSNFDGEKTFEKKPYGEKKSFGDRKPYGEKKSFGDRKPYGEKKSFGDRKPYGEKKSFGDRKPYGEKKSFGDRKPYGAKKDFEYSGEFKEFKNFQVETGVYGHGDPEKKSYPKKSFGSKTEGEKKSFGDRKPYGEKKSFGDKKTYGDRKPYGEKSFGAKSSKGGYKSEGAGAKRDNKFEKFNREKRASGKNA